MQQFCERHTNYGMVHVGIFITCILLFQTLVGTFSKHFLWGIETSGD